MMIIENKFNIGDKVYIITDEEQLMRIVAHIKILPGNLLTYEICAGIQNSYHYDFELSSEKDLINAL